MAHEISIRKDGKAEVMVAGEAPWHKLGVNVDKAQTWKQAVKLAGLDWTVKKVPAYCKAGDKEVPMPGVHALLREDTGAFLGRAGEDYDIIQHDKMFDWVDSIVGVEGGAHYISAGALFGGSTIWCLAELPEKIRIVGTDDITRTYLLFTDYRTIGKSAIVKNVQERVVCFNTLTSALAETGKLMRVPHRDVDSRLKQAKIALDMVKDQNKDINKVMNMLAKIKLKSTDIGKVVRDSFPEIETSPTQQNKARDILELFESNDKNAFPSEAGSAYALMNAGTNFADHVVSVKTKEGEDEAQARARGALFGAGEAFKFAWLTSLVTTLSKSSMLSLSDKEARAIGII